MYAEWSYAYNECLPMWYACCACNTNYDVNEINDIKRIYIKKNIQHTQIYV